MKNIFLIVLINIISVVNIYGDEFVSPEVECCFENNSKFDIQNKILKKYLSRTLKKRDYIIIDKTLPIIYNNNSNLPQVKKSTSEDFNWINFMAQLATIISLIFGIYIYLRKEKNKRKQIENEYSSLTKYFGDRILSYLPFLNRQAMKFKDFADIVKDNPIKKNKLEIESNVDSKRIRKIESEKLYASISFINSGCVIDSDYYDLLYGVDFTQELMEQAKDNYLKYLDDASKIKNKLIEIRSKIKITFKKAKNVEDHVLINYSKLLSSLSEELNVYKDEIINGLHQHLEQKESLNDFDSTLLEFTTSFNDEYNSLLSLSESISKLYNGFANKFSDAFENMKIFKDKIKLTNCTRQQ